MISSLQPDDSIPGHIYELASSRDVGSPIKRYKPSKRWTYFYLFFLVFPFIIGWICYELYGYISFNSLLRIYPNVSTVPAGQLSSYLWLHILHDNFWRDLIIFIIALIVFLIRHIAFPRLFGPKLYFCSDGLLLIYRKGAVAARWDEIQQVVIIAGGKNELIKEKGTSIVVPRSLISAISPSATSLILEEVTSRRLPGVLSRYGEGEAVTLGKLTVDHQGIVYPGGRVYWEQLSEVKLITTHFMASYGKPEQSYLEYRSSASSARAKWHSLSQSASAGDLHLLVSLVNHVLEQRTGMSGQEIIPAKPALFKLEAGGRSAKNVSRVRRTIGITVAALLILFVQLIAFYPLMYLPDVSIQQSALAQQQYFKRLDILRHQPYAVHVPGQNCDNSQGYWSDYSGTNIFTCRQNGLLMIQKDPKYLDQSGFSYGSVIQPPLRDNPMPHHYRIQVNATLISDRPDMCVGMLFHLNNGSGGQEFLIYGDGSWSYNSSLDNSNSLKHIADGMLSRKAQSYVITIDVTDNAQSLYVDNKEITFEYDNAFTSTDEIDLVLDGTRDAKAPVSALFSDFRYTPYP